MLEFQERPAGGAAHSRQFLAEKFAVDRNLTDHAPRVLAVPLTQGAILTVRLRARLMVTNRFAHFVPIDQSKRSPRQWLVQNHFLGHGRTPSKWLFSRDAVAERGGRAPLPRRG